MKPIIPFPVSAPTGGDLGVHHAHPHNKGKLEKWTISACSWTHQRSEFAGQTTTLKSGGTGTSSDTHLFPLNRR